MPIRPADHGIVSASGAGAGTEFSGGSHSTAGGYNYQTYTATGTVTCVVGGIVDLILVGGGGGRNQTYLGVWGEQWQGGGGSGGVIYATGVTVAAGTSSLTIGAGNTGDGDGGNSSIDFAGWNLFTGGGGRGGMGFYNCQNGWAGLTSTPSVPYVTAGGAGGGPGEYPGLCGGYAGAGSATSTSGTGSGGGTWSTLTSGNGGASGWLVGGGGGATANGVNKVGGAGHTWVDGVLYGQGGNSSGDSTAPQGGYGSGAGSDNASLDGGNGIFIVRWPE